MDDGTTEIAVERAATSVKQTKNTFKHSLVDTVHGNLGINQSFISLARNASHRIISSAKPVRVPLGNSPPFFSSSFVAHGTVPSINVRFPNHRVSVFSFFLSLHMRPYICHV